MPHLNTDVKKTRINKYFQQIKRPTPLFIIWAILAGGFFLSEELHHLFLLGLFLIGVISIHHIITYLMGNPEIRGSTLPCYYLLSALSLGIIASTATIVGTPFYSSPSCETCDEFHPSRPVLEVQSTKTTH